MLMAGPSASRSTRRAAGWSPTRSATWSGGSPARAALFEGRHRAASRIEERHPVAVAPVARRPAQDLDERPGFFHDRLRARHARAGDLRFDLQPAFGRGVARAVAVAAVGAGEAALLELHRGRL